MSNSTSHSAIALHCREIDRCSQRGGRMLSMVDLLKMDTVNLEMAGYFLATIRKGTSFIVGARPGGAGKTTVMCALLNFIPADYPIVTIADGITARQMLSESGTHPGCCIAHEIGDGPWYAYLWGKAAAEFFHLQSKGHMVATNLHSDTLEEAYTQLCIDNPVCHEDFQAVGIKLFLHVGYKFGVRERHIAAVHEADGGSEHKVVFRWTRLHGFEKLEPSALVSDDEISEMADVIRCLVASDLKVVEEVRRYLVNNRVVKCQSGRDVNTL